MKRTLFIAGFGFIAGLGAMTSFAHPVSAEDQITETDYTTYNASQDFEARWRLVEGTRVQPPNETVDRWLTRAAKTANEWMLRAAALDALKARMSPKRIPIARDRLHDAYPRVRMAALHVLRSERSSLHSIANLARHDPWPLVRADAVTCLDHDPRALPLIRAMLGDASMKVRRAAIDALTQLEDCTAWPMVKERLLDPGEWPAVIASALGYMESLCPTGAEEALAQVIERGQRTNVWAPDRELASASMETLGRIGGPESLRRLQQFREAATNPVEKKYFENLIRNNTQDRCPARNTRDSLLPVRHLTRGIFP